MVFLCLASAFIAGVVLTHGFDYAITCPKCGGKGEVWDMWYDSNVGTWLQGYRTCGRCDGSGKFWLHAVSYSTVMVSFFSILAFWGLFGFEYSVNSLWLDHNPWVRDVKEMGFWFNPMYFVWLFYKNRRKWAKWTAVLSFLTAILLVVIFGSILYGSSNSSYLITRITPEVFWKGCIFGIASASLFAIGLYEIVCPYAFKPLNKTKFKPELTTLEACHRLAPIEGRKRTKRDEKMMSKRKNPEKLSTLKIVGMSLLGLYNPDTFPYISHSHHSIKKHFKACRVQNSETKI